MSTVKLQASDDFETCVEVSETVARMSTAISNMLDDIGTGDHPVVLQNVNKKTLTKIVEYCTYHIANPEPAKDNSEKNSEDISPWDKNYMLVDHATLFDLILAANFLDIKPLLDLGCKTVANKIKGKTTEEIRETFRIPNGSTSQ